MKTKRWKSSSKLRKRSYKYNRHIKKSNNHTHKHKKHIQKRKTYGGNNIQKNRCSPKPGHAINNYSCYTETALKRLKEEWNNNNTQQIQHNDPIEIHKQFTFLLGGNEQKWLSNKSLSKLSSDLNRSFAPQVPKSWHKNNHEWLSNVDIENVMKQYQRAFKNFAFLGPSPIDFDTRIGSSYVNDDIHHFRLDSFINNNINKIGIIFNTDKHNGPGEHWISMFINIPEQYIFFFDSVGDNPPKEIQTLIQRIHTQSKQLNIPLQTYYNNKEHQYSNTECGMYSLYVIIHLLTGKLSPHILSQQRLPDKDVHAFRRKYFNF